ncbi:MAG TPA: VOC family protein [bacterium]|nr:VOC family protein [bacterium]
MADLHNMALMLHCRNLQETIDFYTGTLGFTLRDHWPSLNPTWCVMNLGHIFLMFIHGGDFGEENPRMTGRIYTHSADVRSVYSELAGKVEVVKPPHVTPYDMLEFWFKDPNGYVICVGQSAPQDPTA